MKLRLLLFLVVAMGFFSCREKVVQCHYSIDYLRGAYVAFAGFTQQELDTIIVRRYDVGSNFQRQKDTFFAFTDTTYRRNDTNYCPNNDHYFFIDRKYDYEFLVKKTNSLYRTNNIETGPTEGIHEVTGHCSPGAGEAQILPYTSVIINEVKQIPSLAGYDYTYFVFLVK